MTGRPNFREVLHVAGEVDQAAGDGLGVLGAQGGFGDAAVHLEGANGGDDDGAAGFEAGAAAFDVEELLAAEVGTEAGFGDHHVCQAEAEAGGDDAVAAMGDVGERAAVDEGRAACQGLDQVGREGVAQQGGHAAIGL